MKESIKKTISLLSVIRGYNILVLIAAQYLAAIFIFSNTQSIFPVIFDKNLFLLIFATVCVVASGYIINNFYDSKADQINRPIKTGIDNLVKQETKLQLYFFLNFCGFLFGSLVSWRAALFFSVYIFGIWLYSHKLKKHAIIGLISASTLTILPFFVVFVHYKNFSSVIFIHALFLFLILLARELLKDLENIKGAMVNNYQTFPVVYGERKTKQVILFVLLLTLIPTGVLLNFPAIEYMKYYFYLSTLVAICIACYIQKAHTKKDFQLLHNILKLLLLAGVISLVFIDKTLILDKVVEIL